MAPVVQAKRPSEEVTDMYDHVEEEGCDVYIRKNLAAENSEEGITLHAVGSGNLTRLIVRGLKNF